LQARNAHHGNPEVVGAARGNTFAYGGQQADGQNQAEIAPVLHDKARAEQAEQRDEAEGQRTFHGFIVAPAAQPPGPLAHQRRRGIGKREHQHAGEIDEAVFAREENGKRGPGDEIEFALRFTTARGQQFAAAPQEIGFQS